MEETSFHSATIELSQLPQQQLPNIRQSEEPPKIQQQRKEYNPRKRYFSFVNVLSIVSSLILSVYIIFEPRVLKYVWSVITPEETASFEVNLKSCKIPNLYDGQSELPFMWAEDEDNNANRSLVNFNCSHVEQFSSIANQKLDISPVANKCCIRNISRAALMDSDTYKITPCMDMRKGGSIGNAEIMFVQCNSSTGRNLGWNVHTALPTKPSVVEKISYWRLGFGKNKELPYSVIVMVLGKTSRAHAYRSLPKTMEFLEQNNFVAMKGYHMMEDEGGNNMVPLVTGFNESEAFGAKQYWDNISSTIWSEFNEEKFVTMLLDDSSSAPHDQDKMNGSAKKLFVRQPTDYYSKPLIAAFSDVIKTHSKDNCVGNRTMSEFLLQHLLKFHDKFKKMPTFSLSHFSWPQAQFGLESLAKMDQAYLTFFKDVFTLPQTLERTFFVITSDNGDIPTHPYFATEHGTQEKLNPLLTIRLPDKLVQMRPTYLENLRTNSHRIVSPLDVHKSIHIFTQISTVKDSWQEYMNTAPRNLHGANLFTSEIPYTRTCSQAFVPERLCLCDLPPPQNYNGRSIIFSNGMPEKYWHPATKNR